MPTKAQIEKWIPGAVADFQSIMPPIDTPYPPTYIANSRNFNSMRDRLVRETGSTHVNGHNDEIGEYISGSNGGAILMCQTLLDSNRRMDFCECYWHELGHFYAITTQEPGLDHYSDPHVVDNSRNFIITEDGPVLGLSDERIIQQGYWFWQEFVAQAIANTVMHKLRPIKQVIWHPDNWYWISDALNEFLMNGLYANYFNIDEYSLAQYFATYLLDDCARGYVQAALDGKLLAHNMDGDIVPTSVEPTGFSKVPEGFQEPLWRMKDLVEKQLQNEQFWLISKDALFGFGNCIADMMLVKFKLIASGKL